MGMMTNPAYSWGGGATGQWNRGATGSWEPLPAITPMANIPAPPSTMPNAGAIPMPKNDYTPTRQATVYPDLGDNNRGGFPQPVAGNIEAATRIWESMAGPATPQGPAYVWAGGTPQERFQETQSQITRPEDPRRQSGGSGGYGGYVQRPPMQAIPAPTMPTFKSPEYKPPEEDKGAYTKARAEAIAPGLRELRQGTREAIVQSQSLDNPNARASFISQALQGYGAGLEKVAAGAASEARQVAGQKRAEQLKIYDAQYSNLSYDARMNYQNEVNRIATDYANQQAVAQQNYQSGYGSGSGSYGSSPYATPMPTESPSAYAARITKQYRG